MKIWNRLKPEYIFLNVFLPDKDAVFEFVAETFAQKGIVKDADKLCEGLNKREEVMSTGIGKGIGIPHTTSSEAANATILLIRLINPIDFESLDALPVDIILPIVVPEYKTGLHLQILAGLSRLCRNPEFTESIRHAENSEQLLEQIKDVEESISFH